MAHTPGPWSTKPYGVIIGGVVREYVNGTSQDQLAMVCGIPEGNGTQEDNARLIAAAPELLEALRWYVENDGECLVDHQGRLKSYQELITKATL